MIHPSKIHPSNFQFKSVAILITGAFAGLLIPLARHLKQTHGSAIHCYVKSEQERRGLQKEIDNGIFDTVTAIPNILVVEGMENTGSQEWREKALHYEKQVGRTFQQMTFTHRALGRGYNAGGLYYPSVKKVKEWNYDNFLRYYCAVMEFWERELTEKQVTLNIQTPFECIAMAQSLDIPHRRLDASRVGDYWIWTYDEFHVNSDVARTFETGNAPRQAPTVPYKTFSANSYFGKSHLMTVMKRVLYYNVVRLRLYFGRGGQGIHRYSEMLRMIFEEYVQRRKYRASLAKKLPDIGDNPFFYLPLHKEPETGLQMMSPEFFNQHWMVMALAQYLPAGVLLLVKENNKTFGRRPYSFYEQISDLKNVVLVDDSQSSLELIEKALCTVTISGSAGFEAAVSGKPTISFGQHNMYNVLPHVMVVEKIGDLKEYVSRVIAGDFDQNAARALGEQYLGSVIKHSFDMEEGGAGGIFHRDVIEEKELVGRAADALVDTFPSPVDHKNKIDPVLQSAEIA